MGKIAKFPTQEKMGEELPFTRSVRGETPLQDEEGAWNELTALIPVLRWVQDELTCYRDDPDRTEGPSDLALGYIVAMTTNHLEEARNFGHKAYFKNRREEKKI